MSVPKPALAQSLTEAAISPGIVYIDGRADRRSAVGLREWVLTAVLFLVPLVTYWPATFHDYGLRDDYSNLREAHEEPGKVLQFCASHARPDLRLVAAIDVWPNRHRAKPAVDAFVRLAVARRDFPGDVSRPAEPRLVVQGTSLCVAVLLALLPSAQVIAAWAVGWPYAAAALLAVGAFFTRGRLVCTWACGPATAGRWASRWSA